MPPQKHSQRQSELVAKQRPLRPEVVTAGQTGAQTHRAALVRRAGLAPRSLTPRDVRQLQRAVGNRAVGQLLARTARPRPSESKENATGLPDGLKAGVEHFSGTSLDDVKVHYNSSLPARHEALAYTQGADIYIGPGQEKHLPHEAWHVVQQSQGRVSPNKQMQSDAPVNDDQALEKEADVIGARAAGVVSPPGGEAVGESLPSSPAPARPAVRQYMLQELQSEDLPTPAESVKRATGVVVSKQLLPGGKVQPASKVKRPKKVSAVIDKNTVRTDARDDDGILSKVTAMARAEQRILQGTDMQKFYDAGHLVADQLVAGDKTDSFVYWNLAPQISSFNTPAYSGIEDKVRALAESNTVRMEVELQYPPDYAVTVGHLKQRGIVATSNSPDNAAVNFYRRIPNKWTMHALVVGAQGTQTNASYPRIGSQKGPSLGNPFFMESAAVGAQQSPMHKPELIGYAVSGEQWAPSTEVEREDILSLLASKFQDLGTPEQIASRILTDEHQVDRVAVVRLIKEAAGDVALAQMDLSDRLSGMKDPSVMQEYLRTSEPAIRNHLNVARNVNTDLATAVHHLVIAKSWVEALIEQADEMRREQDQQFFFSLTQQHQFNENLPETKYARAFDFSITQSTPQFSESSSSIAMDDEVEEQRSRLVDLAGKYQTHIPMPSIDGGEIMMNSFTTPELLYNQAVLIENNQVVRVQNVTKEVTLDNMATGRWIIRYKY